MNTEKSSSPKRLFRSSKGKIIAGICAGLGDYFEMDPVFIRIVFLLFLFAGGAAILLYLILWLIVPKANGCGC